jgi:enamine deaminase RidA (YjgF/YER057c/UK114 family)
MKRRNVTSGSPFEETIGFSRAVRIGNYLAVAGTAPIAPDGSTASPGDPYLQTLRCLEIMKKAIEDGGGRLKNVIRTRIYITEPGILSDVGRAHAEYFRDIKPASTVVVVKGLVRDDWLVELEADCVFD